MQPKPAAIVEPDEPTELMALMSEPALATDWGRGEEDAAWQHLQEAT
jgi:hypothetical protein